MADPGVEEETREDASDASADGGGEVLPSQLLTGPDADETPDESTEERVESAPADAAQGESSAAREPVAWFARCSPAGPVTSAQRQVARARTRLLVRRRSDPSRSVRPRALVPGMVRDPVAMTTGFPWGRRIRTALRRRWIPGLSARSGRTRSVRRRTTVRTPRGRRPRWCVSRSGGSSDSTTGPRSRPRACRTSWGSRVTASRSIPSWRRSCAPSSTGWASISPACTCATRPCRRTTAGR